MDNERAKAAAENEKERANRRKPKGRRVAKRRSKGGRVMVSGAMLMEVETVLQTQVCFPT